MATAVEIKETKTFLESQGQLVELIDKDQERRTWYRPDGLPIPGQPYNGYTVALNMRKGWTLTPPENPVKVPSVPVGVAVPVAPARVETQSVALLQKPPRHIHVMQPEVGSPCLVLGCAAVRQNPRGKWGVKSKGNA